MSAKEKAWQAVRDKATPELWWFRFKLSSDTGIYYIRLSDESLAGAIKQCMEAALCPERSILEIKRIPYKPKKSRKR